MKVYNDVNIWSFWGDGWIVVPTLISKEEDCLIRGQIGTELNHRFSNISGSYSFLMKKEINNPVAYKKSKNSFDEEILISLDPRLPSNEDNIGVVLFPFASLENEDVVVSWEMYHNNLLFLKNKLRKSLFGDFFIPVFSCNEISQEMMLEEIEDTLVDTFGISLVFCENDMSVVYEKEKSIKKTSDKNEHDGIQSNIVQEENLIDDEYESISLDDFLKKKKGNGNNDRPEGCSQEA